MCRYLAIIAVSFALPVLTGCSSTNPPAVQSVPSDSLSQTSVTPPVSLNYVYLTLDAETLNAINDSPFIRDHFCRFGNSIPEPSMSKTGPATYLLGQTTCLELIAAPPTQTEAEGTAGICFRTKETGDINIVYDNLRAKLGTQVKRGANSFNIGDEQVLRLRYITSHSIRQTPPLLTWVTEPNPTFRKAVGFSSNRRQDEPLEADSVAATSRLFRNITSITLDLTQAELDHLDAELSAYGYAKNKHRNLTVFSGPGIEIRAAVSKEPKYRIRTIRCSLSAKPQSPTQMSFGNKATLTFTENADALWTFGPRQTHFARKQPQSSSILAVRTLP